MNVKKAFAAGAAVAVFISSALNVSAAEMDLIIDVDAYKAAYSDLEEAFGDDEQAYIEHYLTKGVYEGRTKGVLFDPLAYAEAYSDIKEAFGDDIQAIVNHYVTLGVTENRTIGTANGYADLAAAKKGGPRRVSAQSTGRAADYYGNASDSSYGNDIAGSVYAGNTAGTGNSGNAAGGSESVGSGKVYGHTTSIYGNDYSELLRVEYYDQNNKLIEYSDVTNYDKDTNSYTENVYSNKDGVEVHERTDTYVNGVLVSSEKH